MQHPEELSKVASVQKKVRPPRATLRPTAVAAGESPRGLGSGCQPPPLPKQAAAVSRRAGCACPPRCPPAPPAA
jgi:hypothetical protein